MLYACISDSRNKEKQLIMYKAVINAKNLPAKLAESSLHADYEN